jgi:N-acetylglucosamine-6-phosphate deacetylase
MAILIKNGDLYAPGNLIKNGAVLVENNIILAVGESDKLQPPNGTQIINAGGNKIIPGLIDTHIHGAGGFDMTGSGVKGAADYLVQFGITSFLATTHFLISHDELLNAVAEIANEIESSPRGAHILGIHMEGPWIAADRSPTSSPALCYPISQQDVQEFQHAAGNYVRMVTFAPELVGALDVIPWLRKNNVIPSVGHTNADYHTVQKAVSLGLNHSTHTFNAMQPMHHRNPGTVGAILDFPEITAEMIADGFHIQPPIMRLLIKAKGIEKVCLVSDAVPLAGLSAGTHIHWHGFDISTDGEISTLPDGRPAGAYKLLNQELKVLVESKTASFEDALTMASRVPAEMLGIRKGRIIPGFDADLVILNDHYMPELTMVAGKVVYSSHHA